MIAWFRRRYLDLLGSIYIYNEHRGYTAIDRVLEAVRARWPDDHALLLQIEKPRADERKHYLMFRRWFEARGVMPLAIDRTCGHIDRFVGIMFRSSIDEPSHWAPYDGWLAANGRAAPRWWERAIDRFIHSELLLLKLPILFLSP